MLIGNFCCVKQKKKKQPVSLVFFVKKKRSCVLRYFVMLIANEISLNDDNL